MGAREREIQLGKQLSGLKIDVKEANEATDVKAWRCQELQAEVKAAKGHQHTVE